jgi:hypothetical protein
MERSTCFFEASDSDCVDILKVDECKRRPGKRRDMPHCFQVAQKVGRRNITEETEGIYGAESEFMYVNRPIFLTYVQR